MNTIKHSYHFIQIYGNASWKLLNQSVINQKIVDIVDCQNNYPNIGPLKFMAEEVYIRQCDRNHLYYWLHPKNFPYLKNLYIDSDDEPMVYDRFTNVNIYITEDKGKYKNVKIITKEYMNKLLSFHNNE